MQARFLKFLSPILETKFRSSEKKTTNSNDSILFSIIPNILQIFLLPRVSTDIPIFFFFKKIRRKGKFRREKREKASFQDHIPISRYRCIDRGIKRAQLEAVANRSNYPFKAARAIAADRTRWKRN